mmetsp:Transcript_1850/g.5623  ORF Transcript_1850/g.5623 Transcript_1850/m.5623 type:complete len:94 (+) Transcript_1850:284-565(+)
MKSNVNLNSSLTRLTPTLLQDLWNLDVESRRELPEPFNKFSVHCIVTGLFGCLDDASMLVLRGSLVATLQYRVRSSVRQLRTGGVSSASDVAW